MIQNDIGYCICMGIYCVGRVLLLSCPSLKGQPPPKKESNTIYSLSDAITFLLYILWYCICENNIIHIPFPSSFNLN